MAVRPFHCMKRMLRALAGAALVLTAAASGATAQDPADRTASRLSVALHWTPGIDFAGFYLAESRGLYAAEGLAVRFRHTRDGGNAVAELADGSADLAVAWLPTALKARAEGAPVVEIAQLLAGSSLRLVCPGAPTLANRGPAALAGVSVGRWRGAAGQPLALWLALMGLDSASGGAAVRPVDQPLSGPAGEAPDAACFSARRHVDAPPPDGAPVLDIGETGAPLQEDSVFAIARTAADPSQATRFARFLRASAAGWALAFDDPAAATRAVAERGGPTLTTEEAARRLARRAELLPAAGPVAPPSPEALHDTAVYMLAVGGGAGLSRYPAGAQIDSVFARIEDLPPPRPTAGN